MDSQEFDEFMIDASAKLRRAYLARLGWHAAAESASFAVEYAYRNRERIAALENPLGYLYRVGFRSQGRRRPERQLPLPPPIELPGVDPDMIRELRGLPRQQRTVLWLVYGCQFTYREAADAMGITASAVGTHLRRGADALRKSLGASYGVQ